MRVCGILLALVLIAPSLCAEDVSPRLCESFARFQDGKLAGQSGWTTEDPDHLEVSEGTIRHRAVLTPDWGQFLLASPSFGPRGGLLEVDLSIDGRKGEYVLGTLSSNGTQNVFVRFKPNGVISVFQVSQYIGSWTPTAGRWSPGNRMRIGIESIKGPGPNNWAVKIHKDGEEIFSGKDNAIAVGKKVEGMTQFFVRRHREGGTNAGSITLDAVRLGCDEPSKAPE